MSTKTEVGGIASERLRSLIERIERLEEEKKRHSIRYSRRICRSQKCRL